MSTTEHANDLLRRHEDLSSGRLPVMEGSDEVEQIHLARYSFAEQYAKGEQVLDCATGIGYGAFRLASKGGAASVTGVDVSAEALRAAREHYSGENLTFQLITPGPLPFGDESFGTVVSFETVEHAADPRLFVRELRRVLRPGGALLISTPNKRFHSFGRHRPWNPHHAREFTPAEFLDLLRDYFSDPEFWGGQEFLPLTSGNILRNNWTEFRYYRLLHQSAYTAVMKSVRSLRNTLQPVRPPASTDNTTGGKPSSGRSAVCRWETGKEPYTIVAVCRKPANGR